MEQQQQPPSPPSNYVSNDVYRVGQVVWAKLDGFPWWPSKIASVSEDESARPDHYLVYFFGDHNIAFLRASKIQRFSEKYSERVQANTRGFKTALDEAKEWITTNVSVSKSNLALDGDQIMTSPSILDSHPTVIPSSASPPNTSTSTPLTTSNSPTSTSPTSTSPTEGVRHVSTSAAPPPPPLTPVSTNGSGGVPLTTLAVPNTTVVADASSSPPVPLPPSEPEDMDVEEDHVENFVVFSSDKDMRAVIEEQNKRIAMELAMRNLRSILLRGTDRPGPYSLTSTEAAISSKPIHPAVSASTPSSTPPTTPVSIRSGFTGEASNNAFSGAVPFSGVLEGGGDSEDEYLVSFSIQGKLYHGFLISHDSLPASVSPFLASYNPSAYYPPYTLNKIAGMSVAKHHTERLADLGRLVAASALGAQASPTTHS